jgi:hypothetical protein
MTGDRQDFVERLKLVLPGRWFAGFTPILDAVVTGLGSAWSGVFSSLSFVTAQTRIATASGVFLDIAAQDYLGGALPRRAGEADTAYSARIRANLLSPRATRTDLIAALTSLTGQAPVVFEPLNASDTGGYNLNMGYNLAGGYGSRQLPYQFFLTVYRPANTPTSNAGGYGIGPGGYGSSPLVYADIAEFAGAVSDEDILQAVAAFIPTTSIAWTKISN